MSKIVHLCMCGPVTDGWSYQDNMLTKYHKKLGYEVTIITSQWIWDSNGKLNRDDRNSYQNEHGVTVIRLPIKHDKNIEAKFKRYEGLAQTLKNEQPDILFIHGCQFLDIWTVRAYLKHAKNVKTYIDNHADFSNSGTNFLSRVLLHKGVWKMGAKAISPYVTKFYGVMPSRVDFLTQMYGIPKDRVELLVMGADDEKCEEADNPDVRKRIREKLNLTQSNFVIITGGKIDYAKRQTLLLMQAVRQLEDPNIRLIIFGSIEDSIKDEFEKLCDADTRIQYIGWINADDTYEYFAASDLAVFPGRHSVMWEQVAGQGIPMVCKYWEGTTHVDLGGNVSFLYEDSADEIRSVIHHIVETPQLYNDMKRNAKEKGSHVFSYREISRRCIE